MSESTRTRPGWRKGRWLFLFVILLAAGWWRFGAKSLEPVYEGRRLGQWLRGHPREYYPVVQALGTNALPYLLAELCVTDPWWARWAEGGLANVEMGPLWEPARMHRYHARLALQILDTNAVPGLLEALFARPVRLNESDRSYEAAFALTWMASPAAQQTIQEQLSAAMRSPDAAMRRNACLAVLAGNTRGSDVPAQIAALTRNHEPAVRAAATRATLILDLGKAGLLPAIIDRLADENSAIRRLAAHSLARAGTNATVALPALRAAFAAEPSRPRGADDLDDLFSRALSPDRVRNALREAIREIDPTGPLPSSAPTPRP